MSKTPSIAVIPSGYKGGVDGVDGTVYSVLPTNGDADLDFTRNCVATRVNQNGLLEEVGLNVPRLDYSDGGCPSLLLEPQRTNLLAYSEDFSQWTNTGNLTDNENTVISPDGSLNASNIEFGAIGTNKVLYSQFTSSTNDATASIYLKGSGTIRFYIESIGNFLEKIDISLTSSWVRYEVSTDNALGFTGSVVINRRASDTATEVDVWGGQLEQGSYATSYIPTNGGQVTRFKDEAYKDNLESYINSSEGVLYAEIKSLATNVGIGKWISLSDGTSSQRMSFAFEGTNFRVYIFGSNGLIWDYQTSELNLKDLNKVALKYKAEDYGLFLNGVKLQSSNSSESLNTLNQFQFNSFGVINQNWFEGKCKDLRVYNEALTDDELIALTQ